MPPLPIIRNDYGFRRTTCGCRACTINCEYMPGMLSPEDLPRMAEALGYGDDINSFASENLLASKGWKLLSATTGLEYRVGSLVPARQENGHCKFLKDGKCTIHAVSPFGCAFFDCKQSDSTANLLSGTVARAVQDSPLYKTTWDHLDSIGRRAMEPSAARAQLDAAWKKEQARKKHRYDKPKERNRKGRR